MQVVEALGDLILRAFEPDHADIQRISSHQAISTIILSRCTAKKRRHDTDPTRQARKYVIY